MARVNVNILGISQLKWTGMGEFNSDDHYIYYCGQESLRRHGIAIMVNKRVWNAVLGCNLKNDRIISVHLQGKPFNITVIQVYAPTSKAEEAEVEWFYEDLPPFRTNTQKRCPFHYRGLECKSRKSRDTWSNSCSKVLHSRCQPIWKTQQRPQDWKRSVFTPIPKKGNAKECRTTAQFTSYLVSL